MVYGLENEGGGITMKTVLTVAALSLASLVSTQAPAQADNEKGQGTATAQLVKECSEVGANDYGPWSYCEITSSNIPQIPTHSRVYYVSSTTLSDNSKIVSGLIDSNVLLVSTSNGSLATGRCTYDAQDPTSVGLCQYTDGIGDLAGFTARLVVTPAGGASYNLTGPYQFKDVNNQQAQSD